MQVNTRYTNPTKGVSSKQRECWNFQMAYLILHRVLDLPNGIPCTTVSAGTSKWHTLYYTECWIFQMAYLVLHRVLDLPNGIPCTTLSDEWCHQFKRLVQYSLLLLLFDLCGSHTHTHTHPHTTPQKNGHKMAVLFIHYCPFFAGDLSFRSLTQWDQTHIHCNVFN